MPRPEAQRVTWGDVLSYWPVVLADLHQWYGIDLDSEPWRPWVVIRARISGLLTEDRTRLARVIAGRSNRGA